VRVARGSSEAATLKLKEKKGDCDCTGATLLGQGTKVCAVCLCGRRRLLSEHGKPSLAIEQKDGRIHVFCCRNFLLVVSDRTDT